MPTRAQRPRLPEVSATQLQARLAWNQGKTGKGRPAASAPAVETCTVDGCGNLANQPRPNGSMVRVHVAGSTDPARWYCPGRCAAIGRALADLRSIDQGGGAR